MLPIVNLVPNAVADQKTLVTTTSTEVVAADTRSRTIAVMASGVIYLAIGAAASLDSYAVPANTIVFISLPPNVNLRAYAVGTPTVNTHEVKVSS